MIIRIDMSGGASSDEASLTEGLHAIGRVKGRIDPETLMVHVDSNVDVCSLSDIDAFFLHGDAITYRIERSLRWIAPDISGVRDVFYMKHPDGGWVVSDEFFALVEVQDVLTPDEEAIFFFLAHGYFRGGRTYFQEIKRVRTGNRLVFSPDCMPFEENLFSLIDSQKYVSQLNYQGFTRILPSVFEADDMNDRDAVLLSGGCDSGLIASISCLKSNCKPRALTHSFLQALDSNEHDVSVAKSVSEYFGLSHSVVPVDFNKLDVKDLDRFVSVMPLAAHFSLNFFESVKAAADLNVRNVWCGQNADSTYNLGPTSRLAKGAGKGDLIKRFLLSREYHRTMPDVIEGSWLNPFYQLAGHLGAKMAQVRYGTPFAQPENMKELIQCFGEAEHYLALYPGLRTGLPGFVPPISLQEARERLFEEKLSSFLVGRDARIVLNASALKGMEAIRPFSAPSMMIFFRSLEMRLADTLYPKRFLYRYHRNLLGSKAYKQIYGRRTDSHALKSEHWHTYIMNEAEIGRQLRSETASELELLKLHKEGLKLQHFVSLYWYMRVMKRVKELGTRVAISVQ